MGAAPRRKPAKRVSKRAPSNRVKPTRGGASKKRVSKAGGGDTAVVAKDVKAKKVEWYWRGRLPKGMLTLIAGRPDQGKGLVSAPHGVPRGRLASMCTVGHRFACRKRYLAAAAVSGRAAAPG